jgi:hypothetical protein
MPRQVNAPAPKAQKAVLAAGDIDSSFSLNQRDGSKLRRFVSACAVCGLRHGKGEKLSVEEWELRLTHEDWTICQVCDA